MTIVLLISCLLLLLLSGFFSASETALMSLGRTDLKRMSESDATGRRACRLLERPQRLLQTILVGNMFVNILFASLFASLLNGILEGGGTSIFERLGGWLMPNLGNSGIHRFDSICRMLLNIMIVTPALMLFGEHTPKLFAFTRNTLVARIAAYPLSFLCVILHPVNAILRGISGFFLIILGQKTHDGWEKMTTDELLSNLNVSEESGSTSEAENQMLARIVDFGGICIDEVMTPRTRLVGLEEHLTLREAYEIARTSGHTWYPVYSENPDGIWGMLSLVDYPTWKERPEMEQSLAQFRKRLGHNVRMKHAVYKPKYVPKTAHIDRVLKSMRQEGRNVVVVVDEHGGTEGIATLNDIVSELLGTMVGHGSPELLRRPDGSVIADGRMHLRLLQKEFGDAFDADSEDSVTIGGLLMARLGRMPKTGDSVLLESGVTLRVREMENLHVKNVEIRFPEAKEGGDEH